jgi:uncharacterized protein YwqG/predicted DNA-binding protein (MmcQ/YjbR family)
VALCGKATVNFMATLVESLRKRCREKPGATKDPLYDEEYRVLDGDLTGFARFILDETPPVIMLRCRDANRKRLQKTSRGIRVSDRMHWDTQGWAWTDVALDGSIPEAELLALVDDSYQITYDALYDFQTERLSVLTRKLNPEELFSELLSSHGLSRRHEEIESLSRPAMLLQTRKAVESKMALGQTKIGGQPDLPECVEWPQFSDGRPLAFLAQINLGEAPTVGKPSGLPESGLLSFFSVFGWQVEDDADPQLPRGKYDYTWTRVFYHPGNQKTLQRRRTPPGVNAFKAASVEFVPVTCFPTHTKEPVVANLGWKRDVKDKYDDLVMAYNGARGHQLGNPARNLLSGYADYEQDFVKEVADGDLQLLFQLASDDNAGMCWGDGGFVYFWIGPKDLARKKFDKIFTDCQCG